jgi:hypothetical protein
MSKTANNPMNISDARAIVLELAQQNIVDFRDMPAENKHQQRAVELCQTADTMSFLAVSSVLLPGWIIGLDKDDNLVIQSNGRGPQLVLGKYGREWIMRAAQAVEGMAPFFEPVNPVGEVKALQS